MSMRHDGLTRQAREIRASARAQGIVLVGFDIVVLMLAMFAAIGIEVEAVVAGTALLLLSRWRFGLYRARFHLSVLDEFPRVVRASLVAAACLALFALIWSPSLQVRAVSGLALLGIGLGLARGLVYIPLRHFRRTDVARERFLLVGTGEVADAIAEKAEGDAKYGLDLAARLPDLVNFDLVQAARNRRCTLVLVAFSPVSEAYEVSEVRRGLAAGLTILAVPRYFDLIGGERADDEVFGVPVLRLGGTRPTFGLLLKRTLDIVLATTALILVSPILLVAGLLVKRETGGSMLFRQTRIGKDGQSFELLKLRTVKPDAGGSSDTTWTVAGDHSRVGPVGGFLRKTSIDELPQLWNICRGHMSFVGPRPERPYFVEQFQQRYPHYGDRHRMPAGLTGLAQIHDLRGDTSISDRARFDNRYGDHWSLWSDVKIMLKTVPKVLTGSGG